MPLTHRATSAWVGLVAAAALVAAPLAGGLAQRPSGSPEALRSQLSAIPARTVVLNDFDIGGRLLWAEPHLTPVIDLRSEIYSTEYVRDDVRTREVRARWRDLLRRTKAGNALLKRTSPLTVALQEQLGWTAVAKDAGSW